ncbi:MAG: FAD-dependent oxidoreductase [Bacilli bacterium]|nr:FAD-dependent oxidoreductase [Bacilli bacterium]
MENKECIIIGAGPCGIGAAIELKKLGIESIIIEKGPIGGKVNIAPRVDNYPGYTEIPGPDLAFEFYKKAKANGIKIVGDEVLSLEKNGEFVLTCKRETYNAKTVLISCGTKEKTLGLDKEEELFGHGISYCAICDGHFFRGQDAMVIGGDSSALKEAIYLTRLCSKVYLVNTDDEFKGLGKLITEFKNHDNVEILSPYVATELLGEESLEGVKLKNISTNEEVVVPVKACFPVVGQLPQSDFVKIDGVLDEIGTVPVNLRTMETNVPGLFAGGDILPRDIRQIYLAEHDGVVAARSIHKFLRGE